MPLRTRLKGRGVSVGTRPTGISPSQRLRQVVDPEVIEFPVLQVDSPVSYLTAFFIPAFDAVCPVLPSETVIVALGVSTAGSVDPRIGLLIGLAAFGACVGDNLCYFIGRRFSSRINRHFFSGDRGAKKREWADRTLDRFGARLIIACRFIPGGRTTVTLTCGVTEFRRRTFLWATALAWRDLGELCVRCRPVERESVRREPLAGHRRSSRHSGSGDRGGRGHTEGRRVVEDTSLWSI